MTVHTNADQDRHPLPTGKVQTKIIFQAADYGGDTAGFKAALAVAWTDSLRRTGDVPTIEGLDQLTREQSRALSEVIDYRVHEEKRGVGNLLLSVKGSFRGLPCGALKRHFIGCERQLIGFAELMAAKDRERFVWITGKGWLKNAKKKDGSLYSLSYIWHRLQVLESLGLLIPEFRYRNRMLRKGFLVAKHADFSHVEGVHCVLTVKKCKISPRKPGEKRG